MFNAISYIEDMEKAGFTREQAKILMKTQLDFMSDHFATKSDIKELSYKIDNLKSEMIIKLGAMMVTGVLISLGAISLMFQVFV